MDVKTLSSQCRNRYGVLQKGASTVLVTPAVNSEVQAAASVGQAAVSSDFVSANPNTLCYKSTFRTNLCPSPTTPVPLHTDNPTQFVFLEPVVGSNPESHKNRRLQPWRQTTRFKPTTPGNILPSNATTVLPSKKRKTQSHIARSNKSLMEAQQESTS